MQPDQQHPDPFMTLAVMAFTAQATAMGCPRDRLDDLWDGMGRETMPTGPTEFVGSIERTAARLDILLEAPDAA